MTNSIVSSSNESLNPTIFVACLAAYNDGELHGEWIDAAQSVDNIMSDIKTMLANSPIDAAEEWGIFDTHEFGGISIHEYENIENVSAFANLLKKHGEVFAELYNYYGNLDDALTAINEQYHGVWESEIDFATQHFNACYGDEIPAHIKQIVSYINFESYARDRFIDEFFALEANGKTHVFSNR